MRFKGQMFLSMLGAVRLVSGAEAQARLIEALPGELGQAVRGKSLLVGGWYPQSWYEEFHATLARTVPGSSARAMAYRGQIEDARGLYRYILQAVSPEILMRLAPRILGQYIEGCRLQVEAERNRVRILLTASEPCSYALWQDFFGAIEALIDLTGARDLRARVLEGGQDRDKRAVYVFFWS